jgi:competence protein ComEA
MRKRIGCISVKYFCFWSFIFLMTAAFVMSAGAAPAPGKKAAEQKALAGLVDINSAGQKELEEIKGVGPATAKKIIDGRPYKSVDDLSKAGLNAKAIESIKPFVTVGKAPAAAAKSAAPATTAAKEATKPAKEATKEVTKPVTEAKKEEKKEAKAAAKSAPAAVPGAKVNINTASKAELDALPEIGPAKAQAIIDGRPYKTIEDIMKVSGIKEKTFEKIKDRITVR